ncbi:Isopentenyl-diphosphate Delta-isomerase [Flagellimonas maritima]|uniref:Isopentenyl-diphosphate Delta-isomerase n=1 Tax=Flagellimonas maritima TaxID=1383885 RepID=A0A2Z4LMK1_9FLAO|nr:NUDIX domain-containing protein [Allomuricauda aurantiaca]AWX43035.1 Isopentenyl-diphosphate Delta-isomerase [Allomuricauda aurantiaca]
MDELVDVLDEKGRLTGESCLKSKVHEKGFYHPTVHVWCYTKDGLVLLQRRGSSKKSFPLKWDISVAGHVGAGESLENAAVREVYEEIGVEIAPSELIKIGVFKTEHKHSQTFLDREFNHTYLCQLDAKTKLQKQISEVEDLKWFALNHFKEWINQNYPDLVPNSNGRYEKVIQEIASRL